MGYEYQFPAYTKTKVSVGSQIGKVMEEVEEVRTATDLKEVIYETHNVIHACETLLRQCEDADVQEGFEKTVRDNEERGYYG